MRRGTTKPITCTVDRDFTNYPVVELTLTDGHYKLTFNKSELTITPSTVVVSLTQEQALLFGKSGETYLKGQLKWKDPDGIVDASRVSKREVTIKEILNEEII